MCLSVVALCMLFTFTHGSVLPDYIKRCERHSPDLNKCVLANGRDALPFILKGDRKFKIPPLNPLHLPKISLEPSRNLKISISDLTIDGIQTANLKDLDIDFKANKINADIDLKFLNVIGQYTMEGRLLVPIQGFGPCNITLTGVNVKYGYNFDIIKKSGKEYMVPLNDELKFNSAITHYQFDNLINGNKLLSDETNKVLNDNTREVGTELNSPVAEIIRSIVTEIIKNYITSVSLNDLFL